MQPDPLSSLIARQQRGFSLEQPFYVSDAVFERDASSCIRSEWHLVGHVSRIPEKGQYFVARILNEEIIVIRGAGGAVNAFFNVCSHRGSRICLAEEGKAKSNVLVCPYHAWTFTLDGELRRPPDMPDDFDRKSNGLRRCHVGVAEGLILVNLSADAVVPFAEQFGEDYLAFLRLHNIATAKVAARKVYPTHANWKLVIENYFECYHCAPSHPEYSSLHLMDKFRNSMRGPEHEKWEQRAKALGYPTDGVSNIGTGSWGGASRAHIREGALTESADRKPLAPLLGDHKDFDGGQTFVSFGPLSTTIINNDYAVMFHFSPISTAYTEMVVTWLVRGDAEAGRDYDPDALTWFWDVTTIQDKELMQNNYRGVTSSSYRPGRYSKMESAVVAFIDWYLNRIGNPSPGRLKVIESVA